MGDYYFNIWAVPYFISMAVAAVVFVSQIMWAKSKKKEPRTGAGKAEPYVEETAGQDV